VYTCWDLEFLAIKAGRFYWLCFTGVRLSLVLHSMLTISWVCTFLFRRFYFHILSKKMLRAYLLFSHLTSLGKLNQRPLLALFRSTRDEKLHGLVGGASRVLMRGFGDID